MEKDEDQHDFDATKADLFEAISHPARIRILQALNEKPMGFAQLGRAVGISSGGQLSFHLNKLRHLVKVAPDGNYVLTPDGREALWSVNALRQATGGRPTKIGESGVRHRSLVKPILAVVVITIIALGGVVAFEQSEFASQQQQLASQQRMIGALQNGLPFVDAQNATLVIGQKNFTSYDAVASQSGLNNPTDIAFDSSGDIWISEFSNYRVLEFKPPFITGMGASLVIGQKDFTSAMASTSREGLGEGGGFCCGPNALAFDSKGNLWVDDYGANRILEYKPPFSTGMNASLVIGQKNFDSGGPSGDHLDFNGLIPTSTDRLFSPNALAFDSSGNLWVMDGDDNRVLEFMPPFSTGMNASLVLGQSNFHDVRPSHGINGLSCKFGYVAIDPYNDVWVGDTQNNRIMEFKPPFTDGMNASLIIGPSNIETPSQQAPYTSANLGWLIGFDHSGDLWVSSNDRFLVFKPPLTNGINSFPQLEIGQPNFLSTVWSGGQNGFSIQNFGGPSGLGFDSSGDLWVADSGNNRVLEFQGASPSQNLATKVPFSLNTGQAQFITIGGVTLLAGGMLAVALFRKKARSLSGG